MRKAEPAISVGLIFTRAPFSSRYTLKPRLCFSPPVCQLRSVPAAVFWAENDLSITAVGKVVVVVAVAETVSRLVSVSVMVAVFTTVAGFNVVVVMVIVELAATLNGVYVQVTVPAS